MNNKQKRLILTQDITDWVDEYQKVEPPPAQDKQALVEWQKGTGAKPFQMGRLMITGRELGEMGEDILPPNKEILNNGAAVLWSRYVSTRYAEVETENGQKMRVRKYAAQVPDNELIEDEGEVNASTESGSGGNGNEFNGPELVEAGSPEAGKRAEKYLKDRVPGYIYERMKSMFVCGMDVSDVAEYLKSEIDSMVSRLNG